MAAINEGKEFEKDWKDSYKSTGFYFMRLRDSAKWVQGKGSTFTPDNPCDAIQHTMPFMWLLELKSTKGASVSFNPHKPWEKPANRKTQVMIKHNQVKEIMEAVKSQGIIGGFIINFRPRQLKSKTTENTVYFVHITDFIEFALKTGKGSINQEDCERLGVKAEGNLKKIRYRYDVVDFINRAIPIYINKGYINKEHLQKVVNWLNLIIT